MLSTCSSKISGVIYKGNEFALRNLTTRNLTLRNLTTFAVT